MQDQVSVVIIGAGPAGASCGIMLNRRGIANCLIDRAVFPRAKTCGGLVTEKTFALLKELFAEDELDGLFCDSTSEAAVYDRNTLLAQASAARPFRFADRRHFDHALTEKYVQTGGCFLQGEKHWQADYAGNTISLQSGRTIRFRYLVFADGMNSRSHLLFKDLKKETAFGIEAFVPKEAFPVHTVGLHFGFVDNGYVWVFPKGEEVCIGLGNLYHKKAPYKETLTAVLSSFGLEEKDIRFHGAFLPYGNAVPQEELADNLLLIGDAAGFADPISGEGLYFALLSGKAAAEALSSETPKADYLQKIEPVRRLIKGGVRLQKIFFRPFTQKRFLKLINGRDGFLKFYLDEHVSFYHYSHSRMLKLMKDYKKQKRRKK